METFSMFVDASSLVVVFVPLLVISVSLWFSCKAKWNVLFRDLGVPLGLFWSVLGATGMAISLTDVKNYGPYTAIMLLTITYGGLVSALGYFASFKGSKPFSQNNQQTAGWKAITFIFVTILIFLIFIISLQQA